MIYNWLIISLYYLRIISLFTVQSASTLQYLPKLILDIWYWLMQPSLSKLENSPFTSLLRRSANLKYNTGIRKRVYHFKPFLLKKAIYPINWDICILNLRKIYHPQINSFVTFSLSITNNHAQTLHASVNVNNYKTRLKSKVITNNLIQNP